MPVGVIAGKSYGVGRPKLAYEKLRIGYEIGNSAQAAPERAAQILQV